MIPANICEIVVAVILKAGWEPAFCDVDPRTGNAGVREFDAAWTPAVAAVLAVPNFGTPVAMDDIQRWAQSKSVVLIEDICNAIGATHGGRALGTWGDAAIYSFGYAKIIEHRTGGGLTVQDGGLRAGLEETVQAMPLYNDRHVAIDRSSHEQLRALRLMPAGRGPRSIGRSTIATRTVSGIASVPTTFRRSRRRARACPRTCNGGATSPPSTRMVFGIRP